MPSLARITPTVLLQGEGLVLLLLSCAAYQHLFPHRWLLFALLFLAPDVSLLGYITGSGRWAAALYNTLHTSAVPVLLGLASYLCGWRTGVALALIWFAHVSFDRGLGYGLKFAEGFKPTHMQRAGIWRD
jgi:Domain of unknown function (DUF4260)